MIKKLKPKRWSLLRFGLACLAMIVVFLLATSISALYIIAGFGGVFVLDLLLTLLEPDNWEEIKNSYLYPRR